MWYNPQDLLSRNGLFNFVIGARGVGKTYAFKRRGIKNWLKKGEQFVYVRRYEKEFGKIGNFFQDIEHEFEDHIFKAEGGKFFCDDEVMGYYVLLSTSRYLKSTSFPDVTEIYFDEFIIEEGAIRYIKNEVTAFLELYETIARLRYVRVYFLSNALTVNNPYFRYWNITLDDKRFLMVRSGLIVVEQVDGKEFANKKAETPFGRLISGTEYGDYAMSNKFLLDKDVFVEKRTKYAHNRFTVVYGGYSYGVWFDMKEGKIFVDDTVDPSVVVLTLHQDDHEPDFMFVKKSHPFMKAIAEGYHRGRLFFGSERIASYWREILQEIV